MEEVTGTEVPTVESPVTGTTEEVAPAEEVTE